MRKAKKPIPTHPSKGQRVGYVRVRTFDQNEGRQLEGVERDRTFTDKASGEGRKRPQLEAMLAFVREGDLVICHLKPPALLPHIKQTSLSIPPPLIYRSEQQANNLLPIIIDAPGSK